MQAHQEREALVEQLLRERDFARYFEPLAEVPGSPASTDSTHNTLPTPSKDASLTAFAQLGALRLNAKRAFISLINRDTQYVLAEATQTLSLSNDGHAQGDGLLMGCCAYPLAQSICRHTVALPCHKLAPEVSTPVFIVPDLATDPRFSSLGCTDRGMHFYAGVPIRTPAGHHIGSFCVIDDKPRDSLPPEQLAFLRDMAAATLTHIANNRFKQDYRRSDRMVRGMGALVEGRTSIRQWWDNPSNAKSARPDAALREGHMSDKRDEDQSQVHQRASDMRWPKQDNAEPRIGSKVHSDLRHHNGSDDESVNPVPLEEKRRPHKATSLAVTLSNLFGRASNLIREAMELEGAMFLDASTRNFGGYLPAEQALQPDPLTPSSSSDGELPTSNAREAPASLVTDTSEDETHYCRVLGFSTGKSASINGDVSLTGRQSQLGEQFMASLLRRYPFGKIFHWEEIGAISSSSESESTPFGLGSPTTESELLLASPRKETRKTRKERRLNTLRKTFPEFRSLMFVPLWDVQKNKWHGGVFAWTNREMRRFTEEGELSYLSAFGNSVMAEVAHLDALLADRAKADFISSISHELRSPLHGILGSVEFLQDTASNAFQSDMFHNIETCGRTLLDTIDHLLDFAKINRLSNASVQKPRKKRHARSIASSGPSDGGYSAASDSQADIAILTEEVIHTMVSSNDALESSYRQSQGTTERPREEGGVQQPVRIVVDIAHAPSWKFRIQSGAWRRVVMNLVGNSLKYTDRGYIWVKMWLEGKPGSSACDVRLKVTDTGRGMSKSYIQNSLFTPFVQEDSFSAGTGLGLSIVHQIVNSLHGNIAVRSRQSIGTDIEVTVPMQCLPPLDPALCKAPTVVGDACNRARGLRVQVQCPYVQVEAQGELADMGKEKQKAAELGGSLWRKSIERLCCDWFGMEVLPAGDDQRPDLIIADWFVGQSCDMAHKTIADSLKPSGVPTLVSCSSVGSVFSACRADFDLDSSSSGQRLQFVNQPTGPHNLSAALLRLLDGQSALANPETSGVLKRPAEDDDATVARPVRPIKIQDRAFSTPTYRLKTLTDNASAPESPADVPQVLLVDDNSINLALLCRFMDQLSLSYVTASDGLKALEAYKASNGGIRYVFMDLSMPVMDGLTATREIRQWEKVNGFTGVDEPSAQNGAISQPNDKPAAGHRETLSDKKRASIIALTGQASEASQEEAFSSGIDRFLTKPVRFAVMRSIVGL